MYTLQVQRLITLKICLMGDLSLAIHKLIGLVVVEHHFQYEVIMNNKWDKYNKQKWTRQDEFYAWSKIAMIFLAGYLYFHFIVMGW